MGWLGRWLVRFAACVALLLVAAGAGLWLFLRGSLAQLDGQATGAGLGALVTITRDANGVPSISGQSRADVAFALGFLHAQERFFQMDLLRRVAAGELAELFGPVALPGDREHRFFRFRAHAEDALRRLSDPDRTLLQRYADGVNAGLAALTTRPPDYLLTNSRPRPWTPADSLLVSWAIYFDLQGQLETRKFALGWIRDHTSPAQRRFLLPDITPWDAPLDGAGPAANNAAPPEPAPDWWRRPAHIKTSSLADIPVAGSNNWAIAGSRSQNGRALLANDMHLGLRLPPVWYRVVLSYVDADGGNRRLVGASLPGTPGCTIGSNGHVAWGFTNAAGDWLDVIRLDENAAHPGQVRLGEDWISPSLVEETILVKDAAPETLLIHETMLGPLRRIGGQAYVVHWLAQSPDAANLGLAQMEGATDVESGLLIGAGAGVPQLNMLVADEHGHIGWTIAGPMPERGGPASAAAFPLEPSELAMTWQKNLPAAAHPHVIDPEQGQMETANSRVLLGPAYDLIGDGGYDLGARTQQIRDDLTALGQAVDVTRSYQVVLDDRALFLQTWRDRALAALDPQALADHPERAEFKRLLQESWDGHASVGSVGYRLARAYLYSLYDLCFAALDESLDEVQPGASYRLVSARWPDVLERLLMAQPASWLPADQTDWRALQLAAIDRAILLVTHDGGTLAEASWGRRNRADIAHPFAKFLPLLRSWLSAPADMLPGDQNMPRVAAPDFGSSERLVVAPGKEEEGIFNMPGGQSGHPLSPFFLAGHQDWVQGKASPLLPGPPRYALVLTPQ